MDTYKPQHGAFIRTDQTVDSVTGGLVAGVYIHSLAGPLVVRPTTSPEPPDLETIKIYLEAVSQGMPLTLPDDMDAETTQMLKKLWNTPFRAHRTGDVEPQALDKIVKQVLDENQQRNGYQRLVLLAESGFGKTRALHWMVSKEAARTLAKLESQQATQDNGLDKLVIPFYVNLAHVRFGQEFVATLSAAFNNRVSQKISENQVLGLLNTQEHTCFFVFDDLDQLLFQQQRGQFQTLCQFMATYHEHRYIISCRTSANQRQLGPLDELYLDGLSDEDVKNILDEREFTALSHTSDRLLRNRSALEQYFRMGRLTDLLETKGRYLDIVVEDWFKTITTKLADQNMDISLVRGLLESLSIRMRLDRTHTYSEYQLMLAISDYLTEWRESLPWRKVVSVLADCEFIVWSNNAWSFCDRCFGAYFAAKAVINGRSPLALLVEEASNVWWRDVLEILVGLHQEPNSLLLDLIDQDAFVAAYCLQHAAKPVAQVCEEALVDALFEEFWKESYVRKVGIVERLGTLDHPRACETLLSILHREISSGVLMVVLRSLISWMERHQGISEPLEAVFAAEVKFHHAVEKSRSFTEEMSSLRCSDDSGDLRLPHIAFLMDPSKPVRARSLVALALGINRQNDARLALLNLLDTEKTSDRVAWCAAEAVVMLHPQEDAFEWAKRIVCEKGVQGKPDQQRQARAVYILGFVGVDQETENLLLKAVQHPDNGFARGYAAMALASLDFKDAREKIETLLTHEKDTWVLRQAAEALGRVGTLESLPILERHLHVQQSSARWMIRRAIREILERNVL